MKRTIFTSSAPEVSKAEVRELEPLSVVREIHPDDFAQPAHRTPIPPPPDVKMRLAELHTELTMPEVNVTAAAVAEHFEQAAKEVEQMGAALKEAATNCEAMMAEAYAALKFVEETATAYRENGKYMFERIEQVRAMAASVKTTCTDLRKVILTPTGYNGG